MDFQIENGVLVKYKGKDRNVVIPNGVSNALRLACTVKSSCLVFFAAA